MTWSEGVRHEGLGADTPFESERAGELIVFPITRDSHSGPVPLKILVSSSVYRKDHIPRTPDLDDEPP